MPNLFLCLAAVTPGGLDTEELMYSGVDLLKLESGKGKGKSLSQPRAGGYDLVR